MFEAIGVCQARSGPVAAVRAVFRDLSLLKRAFMGMHCTNALPVDTGHIGDVEDGMGRDPPGPK